jgi:hypothetical protein
MRKYCLPPVSLSQVPPDALLQGFDRALSLLLPYDGEDGPPTHLPVSIGCDYYPLGDVLQEVLTWGKCHRGPVPERTSRELYELLGPTRWPFHALSSPGTYKQAAEAVLSALKED